MAIDKKMLTIGAGVLVGGGILALFAGSAEAASVGAPKGGKVKYPKEGPRPEDLESLARVISSEAGGEPRAIQIAVACATRNQARRLGTSVTSLVMLPGNTYGPQSRGAYAASGREATAAHRQLAADIISGKVPDPTGGATQYDSPAAQRKLLASGAKGYKLTPEELATRRMSEGKRKVLIPGVPEERFRMWTLAGGLTVGADLRVRKFAGHMGEWNRDVHGPVVTGMASYDHAAYV